MSMRPPKHSEMKWLKPRTGKKKGLHLDYDSVISYPKPPTRMYESGPAVLLCFPALLRERIGSYPDHGYRPALYDFLEYPDVPLSAYYVAAAVEVIGIADVVFQLD